MSNLSLIRAYLIFWFNAKRKKGHGVHSPFIFDLVTNVFYKKSKQNEFASIESLRKKMLHSKLSISMNDYGAGARKTSTKNRTVASIAKNSLKPKKQAQLLYRFLAYRDAITILELGTSLGITTAYLAKAKPNSKIISIEGCPNIANIAISNHKQLKLANIESIIGEFKNTLPDFLETDPMLDFVFFDGNHTKQATLSYFNQCLKHAHNETTFIFDDIYLSEEMQEAWKEIISHDKVRASINIFHMGFVFFRKEMTKEHFKLRF